MGPTGADGSTGPEGPTGPPGLPGVPGSCNCTESTQNYNINQNHYLHLYKPPVHKHKVVFSGY